MIKEIFTSKRQSRTTRFKQRLNARLEAEKSAQSVQKTVDSNVRNYYYGGTMLDVSGDRKVTCGEVRICTRPGESPGTLPVSTDGMVQNPSHYNHGSMEVIDVLDAFPHLHYNLLNAMKYVLRCPFKGRQQDIEKAIFYLTRMKELMDKGEPGYFKRIKPEVTE